MRATFGLLAALALLAASGAATAKVRLESVRVCGFAACSETRDAATLDALWRLLAPQRETLAPSPPIGPYYELRTKPERPRAGEEQLGYLVRGTDVLLFGFPEGAAKLWLRPGPLARAELERASEGLEPRPAPRPARVVVDGRRVRNPAAYLAMLGPLASAERPRATGPPWIPVTFVWRSSNPWSGDSSLFYDPDDRALFRGGAWYRVPPSLARMITRPRLGRPFEVVARIRCGAGGGGGI